MTDPRHPGRYGAATRTPDSDPPHAEKDTHPRITSMTRSLIHPTGELWA